MRNFIPMKNNIYKLPHDLYMQMLYILRDYARAKKELLDITKLSNNQKTLGLIVNAIEKTIKILKEEYKKRNDTYGELDAYRAFFDYGYYSCMYARRRTECGASKSAWGLYRSKLAYLLAENLGLI